MNIDMDNSCKSKRTSNRIINGNNDNFITPYPVSKAMLIINRKWVRIKCASQIQDTVMVKDHINLFLDKYKDKSEDN